MARLLVREKSCVGLVLSRCPELLWARSGQQLLIFLFYLCSLSKQNKQCSMLGTDVQSELLGSSTSCRGLSAGSCPLSSSYTAISCGQISKNRARTGWSLPTPWRHGSGSPRATGSRMGSVFQKAPHVSSQLRLLNLWGELKAVFGSHNCSIVVWKVELSVPFPGSCSPISLGWLGRAIAAFKAPCIFARTLNFLGNTLNLDAEWNSSALWQSGFQSFCDWQ